MSEWPDSSRRSKATASIERLKSHLEKAGLASDEMLASVLNVRASMALYGEYADPAESIIDLLVSGLPISDEVRELLAEALAGTNQNYPRISFVGNIGPKSEPGLIGQRRRWLAIADDFIASGLSEPDYLRSNRMLDERQRKTLQTAKAFHRSMIEWVGKSPQYYLAAVEITDREQDIPLLQRKCFCEFVVDNALLDQNSLSDFLRGG